MGSHIISRGTRRFGLGEFSGQSQHPQVLAWAARVVNNSGSYPSNKTINALSEFYYGIDNFPSLLGKMKAANCFVPDNLTASFTPLISFYGNVPWTNTGGFVGTDLSIKGLQGNGSTKFLNSGCIPTGMFAADGIGGMTIYTSVNPNVANTDLDAGVATNSGAQSFYLGTTYSNQTLWHYDNNVGGQGALSLSPNPIVTGYYSGNRTSATLSTLYVANSTIHHYSAGTIITNGGSRPTQAAFVFGNNNAGSLQLPSHKTISFVAFHDGLTLLESEALFNLVQRMRQSLGGGFV